jgi:dienelactone hydrolase
MRTLLCTLLVSISFTSAVGQTTDYAIQRSKTSSGVKYGLWGKAKTKPAPVLFVLASTIDSTLGDPYYRQCGNELAELGYLCVSIDLPCHGTRSREGESPGLSGWSQRAAMQDDFVAENNSRLSDVLGHLIETRVADPDRVAACGTSRGGLLAIHFAAQDERVKCVAGFAPVTDLAALSEFRSIKDEPFVSKLSLFHQADKLAGRPVWIVIGDQDERVGTDRVVAFASHLTHVAGKEKLKSRVELHVMPEPRGHTTPKGSAERAAVWIHRQLSGEVAR